MLNGSLQKVRGWVSLYSVKILHLFTDCLKYVSWNYSHNSVLSHLSKTHHMPVRHERRLCWPASCHWIMLLWRGLPEAASRYGRFAADAGRFICLLRQCVLGLHSCHRIQGLGGSFFSNYIRAGHHYSHFFLEETGYSGLLYRKGVTSAVEHQWAPI